MFSLFNFTGLGLLGLAIAFIGLASTSSVLQNIFTNLISSILNAYLSWRYPIRSRDGDSKLPTCPYQWPNGQGDVGKFFDGIENGVSWTKKYGTIYRIWSGLAPEIVLTRPEHLQAVFKDSDKHHKAINNNSGYLLSRILGQCVGLISGPKWRSVRAITEIPFLRSNMTSHISLVERTTAHHLQQLATHGRIARGLIDPAKDLKMLPFWIVAQVIYGDLSEEQQATLRELAPIREYLFKFVMRGGLARFHWSRFLPTEANRTLDIFQTKWETFNNAAYHRAVSLQQRPPIVDMYEAIANGTISFEQLLQTLDEMLYANLDVTTGGLSWNLVFLAASRTTQTRLRQEISTQRASAVSNPAAWSQYLLSSSSFLSVCISESSRLKPLAAFSVPQSAPTPRLVGGYLIPAYTNFVIDSYALNIRNEFWGPDSTVYRPERFFERKPTDLRYNFWRFGFGPRQCLGKYVADLSIRCVLVQLLEGWELALEETEGEWARDPEMWITHPQIELLCTPYLQEVGKG